jgi:hypothetical protein
MPVLGKVTESAASGCLVKPVLLQFFQDPAVNFEFNLHLTRSGNRAPDGWFHASTHPLMSHRELWLYLARSQLLPGRQMDYISWMSTMMGTVTHGVVEAALDRMGVTVPLPEGDCPACGRPYKPARARQASKWCMEHGAVHPESMSRCHLDSILNFGPQGVFGFDLKTIRPFGLSGITDMDAGHFREKWPHYWAQMQECMRMTGLRRYIVYFMGLGNPWTTREFHIDYDAGFAAQTEAKYLEVLDHWRRGVEIVS